MCSLSMTKTKIMDHVCKFLSKVPNWINRNYLDLVTVEIWQEKIKQKKNHSKKKIHSLSSMRRILEYFCPTFELAK